MAGFTFNGFGASDSYYPLKDLKVARCGHCRKDTMFSLMELRMKIRLLYIPTVSIGKKYAVVCNRCKTGFYVNDEQRQFLLDNPASKVTISPDGVTFHGIKAQKEAIDAPVVPEPTPEPQPAPQPPVVPAPAPVVQQPPVQQKPVYATLKQSEVDAIFIQEDADPAETFRTLFGSDGAAATNEAPKQTVSNAAPVKQSPVPTYQRRKICPACKMMYPPDKQFCGICGGALELK